MRKILALILTMGLATGGCAWFGGSSSEEVKPAQPQEQTAAPEPAPAPEAPAKDAKGKGKTKTKAEKPALAPDAVFTTCRRQAFFTEFS